jgi:hypothetical protein
MKSLLHAINGRAITLTAKGDKVEQKTARALKAELLEGFIAQLGTDFEIMYDDKNSPVVVLDNGLVIGFDFVIKKLDAVLFTEPQTKEPK